MFFENVGESGQDGVLVQMDGESKDVVVASKWGWALSVDGMGEWWEVGELGSGRGAA